MKYASVNRDPLVSIFTLMFWAFVVQVILLTSLFLIGCGEIDSDTQAEDAPDLVAVNIPDPDHRAAIAAALGKASGAPITTVDMATLTRLDAQNACISDLTGLEHAINLTRLDLGDEWIDNDWVNSNSISDLSPLAGLTNLTGLDLDRNNISDISSLAGLTNLTDLNLGDNNISDISSLAGLTNLTGLDLGDNNISDISSLAGLTSLEYLLLGGNNISDISALAELTNLIGLALWDTNISDISSLAGLTNLTDLLLWGNNISDISALVSNAGLGNGDTIDVRHNPLNNASINIHIPTLQNRGVTVRF